MKQLLSILIIMVVVFGINVTPAFAHATVKPSTAGVGAFTDFSLGVPSEKAIATTAVKLTIPAGLNNVSPIVKPGWHIEVKQKADTSGKKDDDGNPAMIVSEIDWTGGLIPSEQKDIFMFSAQVPTQPIDLVWKIEQIYSDGSVISWSLGPNDPQPKDENGNPDYSKFGPSSKTVVINDLKPSTLPTSNQGEIEKEDSHENLTLAIAGLALILSLVTFGTKYLKK